MNEAPKTSKPAKPLTLSDLMGSMERGDVHTAAIDVSAFLTFPDGSPLVLEWRHPSATDVYKIGNFAAFVRDDNPDFHWDLCRDVATMAACHAAPATGGVSPRAFYAKIASSKNEALWFFLVGRLGVEFPHLRPGIIEPETKMSAPRRPRKNASASATATVEAA